MKMAAHNALKAMLRRDPSVAEHRFTATQLARILSLSRDTVRDWVRDGRIPFTRNERGHPVILASDADTFLSKRRYAGRFPQRRAVRRELVDVLKPKRRKMAKRRKLPSLAVVLEQLHDLEFLAATSWGALGRFYRIELKRWEKYRRIHADRAAGRNVGRFGARPITSGRGTASLVGLVNDAVPTGHDYRSLVA